MCQNHKNKQYELCIKKQSKKRTVFYSLRKNSGLWQVTLFYRRTMKLKVDLSLKNGVRHNREDAELGMLLLLKKTANKIDWNGAHAAVLGVAEYWDVLKSHGSPCKASEKVEGFGRGEGVLALLQVYLLVQYTYKYTRHQTEIIFFKLFKTSCFVYILVLTEKPDP